MHAYLLTVRGLMDDLPPGLFASLEDARDAAAAVGREEVDRVADRLGWPGPTAIDHLCVVEFSGGEAVRTHTVADLQAT